MFKSVSDILLSVCKIKCFWIIAKDFLRALEDHRDQRTVFSLGTSSHKCGCGTRAFRLNLPFCGTHFISKQLLDPGHRSGDMSCAVNCKEIEMEFPSAGWISSHEVGFIWKPLVNFWKEFVRQLSNTLSVSSLFFYSEAGEKWDVENNLIPAPWKRAKWVNFSKLGVQPSCSFTVYLCTFL